MRNTMILLGLTALAVPAFAMQAPSGGRQPQTTRSYITFYDQQSYNGREFDIDDATSRFRWDYNIRSIGIHPGDKWQICARPRFQDCIILDRSVPDANMVGIAGGIGSVRPAPADAPQQGSPSPS